MSVYRKYFGEQSSRKNTPDVGVDLVIAYSLVGISVFIVHRQVKKKKKNNVLSYNGKELSSIDDSHCYNVCVLRRCFKRMFHFKIDLYQWIKPVDLKRFF